MTLSADDYITKVTVQQNGQIVDSVSFTSHLLGDLGPERAVTESRTTFVFTKEEPFFGFFSYSDDT